MIGFCDPSYFPISFGSPGYYILNIRIPYPHNTYCKIQTSHEVCGIIKSVNPDQTAPEGAL